jgi:hypothetical protein
MTLIISQVSSRYVLQVSDRLVSYRGRKFDPTANKTVVFIAADSVSAISYSGPAYIQGRSTDRWTAEYVAGTELPEEGFGGSGNLSSRRLSAILYLLPSRLEAALKDARTNPAAARMGIEISVVGWKFKRRRGRPFAVSIIKNPGIHGSIVVQHHRAELNKNVLLAITPSAHAPSNPLPGLRAASLDPDKTEAELVRLVRARAGEAPNEVGSDCMSVLIPPPGFGLIRVRYIGVQNPGIAMISQTGEITRIIHPAAFSPWVVGFGQFAAPSVIMGSFEINAGGFKVVLEAPQRSSGIVGAMGSVVPPKEPEFQR